MSDSSPRPAGLLPSGGSRGEFLHIVHFFEAARISWPVAPFHLQNQQWLVKSSHVTDLRLRCDPFFHF